MSDLAQSDDVLLPWLLGIVHPQSGAGSFLKSLADAALRADWENYPILRPALLELRAKYPKYAEGFPALPKEPG